MGVKIFRDDNWNRIKSGVISRRDLMGLDPDRDNALIRYLISNAAKPSRDSMLRYTAEKYGIDEQSEPQKNIDDPNDPNYEEYFVLQEQVVREDDADVLKEAALHGLNYDMAAFAFCRLTGYCFPVSDCDAYSYRTFDCGLMPGTTAEDIREFCRAVIEEKGRFADAAEECLRDKQVCIPHR